MPGMDGELLGEKIKRDPATGTPLLVMMTTFGRRGDASRMEEIGFSAYLTKPIKQSQLHGCLVMIMDAEQRPTEKDSRQIITRHSISEKRRHGARILLVEDNVTNQKVALGILERLGYRADAVMNGREAIPALENIPYNLVIMDCQMPEMDGYETTQEIRDPCSAVLDHNVPIIALSAHALAGEQQKCIKAGMNDYLSKPVDSMALANAVEKWLAQTETLEPSGTKAKKLNGSKKVFDGKDLLHRLMDDKNLAKEAINAFIDCFPHELVTLKDAIARGDSTEIALRAHTIKGGAGNISAHALMEIAAKMENTVKAGDLKKVSALMPQLKKQHDTLLQALKQTDYI